MILLTIFLKNRAGRNNFTRKNHAGVKKVELPYQAHQISTPNLFSGNGDFVDKLDRISEKTPEIFFIITRLSIWAILQ
jgi:hypothetical protein